MVTIRSGGQSCKPMQLKVLLQVSLEVAGKTYKARVYDKDDGGSGGKTSTSYCLVLLKFRAITLFTQGIPMNTAVNTAETRGYPSS